MSKAGRHCEKTKSLCYVCCRATEDGKVKALLWDGQYRSGYCADVTLGLHEERSSSEQSFLCFTCCQPS